MFAENLFLLPNIQWVIQDMVGELANRRSLLVLLPRQIDAGLIWESLRRELLRKDFWVEEISLTELPQEQQPIAFLLNKLGWGRAGAAIPVEPGNSHSLPTLPQVLYLNGFDKLPLPVLCELMEAIAWWARRSQSEEPPMCQTALCLIGWGAPALPYIPDGDVRLAVHWWWGIPTALEIHFLCRLINRGKGLDLVSRWREDVLPAICGNDWGLLEYLWDKIHLNPEDLTSQLADYAKKYGWTPGFLDELGAKAIADTHNHFMGSPPLQPAKEYMNLWSQGVLQWTPEYGFELHSSALAALGMQESVYHRFWRGQARLILPIIDQMRLELCSYLGKLYGKDWPLRWSQPDSRDDVEALKENPMNVQWGYLCWCLDQLRPLNSAKRWLPLVKDARKIRNELSHYRPIGFSQFKSFWGKAEKFVETICPI
jgi:hypothetical protein